MNTHSRTRIASVTNTSLVSLCTLVTLCTLASAQVPEPGTIPWTPTEHVGLVRSTITVPAKYSALNLNPNVHTLEIPQGWTASVFHAGATLNKPRFMSWGPDSVLFVANMNLNNILALPDANHDGIADTVIQAATGFSLGHDVRFYRDTMYVCQESGLEKLWRSTGTGYVYDRRVRLVDKSVQPNQTGGNHRTRTLGLDTINFKIYISVGSRGNASREADRGLIERYDWDGSNRTVFATGCRNAVGMTIHPRTGRLWANNNGSDLQGNDVPPEWVDIVRENGFYGYPFSYHYQRWFNFTIGEYRNLLPITHDDSLRLASMVPPAALVTAHSAPMALVFAPESVPVEWRKGAFMVMRGSWNRSPMGGNKVIFLEFDNDDDTIANVARDFCTGFAPDSTNPATRWARPVGLAVDARGAVFISTDDANLKQFILKLTPPASTSVDNDSRSELIDFRLQPNPSNGNCRLSLGATVENATVVVADVQGRVVLNAVLSGIALNIDTQSLSESVYHVMLTHNGQSVSRMLSVVR